MGAAIQSVPVAPVLGNRNCDTCRFADSVAAVPETGGYALAVTAGFLVVVIEQDYANIGTNHWSHDNQMHHSHPRCHAHP